MKYSRRTVIFFLVLNTCYVGPQQARAITPYLEINQLLAIAVGAEVPVGEPVVFRGSVGASPGGLSVLTGSGTLAWRLRRLTTPVQIDLEAGVPIAYMSLWRPLWGHDESTADPPFTGFLYGGSICWGYIGNRNALFLVTGIGAWREWQRDDGWKGPQVMPVFAIRYRRLR